MKPNSKLERQLLILNIFHCCEITEYNEITSRIEDVSRRTIDRDIAELTEAGLLSVTFSRKHNGFIECLHNENRMPTANKAKQAHYNKLVRLSDVMFSFSSNSNDNIMDWYVEHYPNVSKRTAQRDLQILKGIGYEIWYDFWGKQYVYDFPSDRMSIFEYGERYEYKDV